ncbi:uncharacterized protein [Drosophila virilis]|uniref:Uncharacterized protein n=1 Tax=Drosophila virilis TaxID=7244 RepID=B4LQ95_DROVI|nr:uncharacterized protein LOC6627068 [Drosophila virilis]EDW61380.2 uncharacterized protein Dvir_GJ22006 [Drosophila virilis]
MGSDQTVSHLLLAMSALCLRSADAYLAFVPSSTHGVFAALAVPLELPHRNVFVSYNFEANYNSPYNWSKPTLFQNGPIESEEVELSRKTSHATDESRREPEEELDIEGSADQEQEQSTSMPTSEPKRERRALLTRSNIYHILMDKFQRSGFSGESCLLRLICETSAAELGEVNGVLGSLIHVLFSPSTSEPEQLPLRFYQAEHDGWNDHCSFYEQNCGESLLELISEPFEQILERIERNEM